MNINFFCPRWGSEHLDWEIFCKKVKDTGYNGIECGVPRTTSHHELDLIWNIIARHNLKIIPQHYDTYEADFNHHFELYHQWLEKIHPYPAVKINSQTGKDFFSFEQNKKLIDLAFQSGLQVVHETHRNKFAFAAHITKTYMEKIPELKLALDASHWVCVAESYLEDQEETMKLAIDRTDHIHARVGFPEGPQIADPRGEQWQEALEKHLRWWDAIIQKKQKEDQPVTITPEFGPFPYMVFVPGNESAVTHQWNVNLYMMELFKKKYK